MAVAYPVLVGTLVRTAAAGSTYADGIVAQAEPRAHRATLAGRGPSASTAVARRAGRGTFLHSRASLFAALLAPAMLATGAEPLPTVSPASQGFSASRLEHVSAFMQHSIARGEYAGAVTLVARHGHIVHWAAHGHADAARSALMRRDAIFRLYSMTKPITSVAALVLLDDGQLALDDPVSRFLPEFARLQVLDIGESEITRLRPANRPITIRDLMRHTAGFAAGEKVHGAAAEGLRSADLDRSPSLAAYAARVARHALAHDPGERFSYDGVSTEVLARVIEVAGGDPFDVFLERHVFAPLRMRDTAFEVPPEDRQRIVAMTTSDERGRVVAHAMAGGAAGEMMKPYPSGAGGLYSTAGDYARFCQMLLSGGILDGRRILAAGTVDLMLTNQLAHLKPPVNEFSDAEGFGLGGYVVLDPVRRRQLGSVGQFGWLGAAGTWFTLDRQEDLLAIVLVQHLPRRLPSDPPRLGRPFNDLVYEALVHR